jgi:hypothetical protein
LERGAYYHNKIHDLLVDNTGPWVIDTTQSDEELRRDMEARQEQYRAKLLKNRDKAIELIIEMLRYQNWPLPNHMDNRRRVTDG